MTQMYIEDNQLKVVTNSGKITTYSMAELPMEELKNIINRIETIEQFIVDARDAINRLMIDYNKRMANDKAGVCIVDGKATPLLWSEFK